MKEKAKEKARRWQGEDEAKEKARRRRGEDEDECED